MKATGLCNTFIETSIPSVGQESKNELAARLSTNLEQGREVGDILMRISAFFSDVLD